MKKRYASLLTLFLLFTTAYAQSGTVMYAIGPQTDSLWSIDTSTYTSTGSLGLTAQGFTVDGCNGLATHPCGGDIYVIYKVPNLPNRRLGILNPATAFITDVGDTGDRFAGIAFSADGTLYGVTGDGGNVPETLFEIDICDASTTLVLTLGNGDDGESIAFNSDDGFMYHTSGIGSSSILERINLTTLQVTNIPLSGAALDEVFGLSYIGNNTLLAANIDGDFIEVTTAGFGTNVGSVPDDLKGMAFPITPTVDANFGHTPDTAFACPTAMFSFTDSSMAAFLQWDFDNGQNSTAQNPSTSYNVTGTYRVVQLASNDSICWDTYWEDVVVDSNPLAPTLITEVGQNPVCPNDTLILMADSAQDASYTWLFNGSPVQSGTNRSYVIPGGPQGDYQLVRTDTLQGCTDTSAINNVNVANLPNVSITPGDTTICPGDTVKYTGAFGGTLQWFRDGQPIFGETNQVICVYLPGYYNQQKTNMNGCTDSSAVGVFVSGGSNPVAGFTQSADTIWVGQSVTFTDATTNGVATNWNFGDGNNGSGINPTHTYTMTGTFNVGMEAFNGVCNDSAFGVVVVIDTPLAIDPALLAGMTAMPNPFDAQLRVEVTLAAAAAAKVEVYDLVGLRIATIAAGDLASGKHVFHWQPGAEVASGVYFLRLSVGDQTVAQRILRMH